MIARPRSVAAGCGIDLNFAPGGNRTGRPSQSNQLLSTEGACFRVKRIRSTAVADLVAVVDYISDNNPEAAQALKEDIERCFPMDTRELPHSTRRLISSCPCRA